MCGPWTRGLPIWRPHTRAFLHHHTPPHGPSQLTPAPQQAHTLAFPRCFLGMVPTLGLVAHKLPTIASRYTPDCSKRPVCVPLVEEIKFLKSFDVTHAHCRWVWWGAFAVSMRLDTCVRVWGGGGAC